MHYTRWKRHGDPYHVEMDMSLRMYGATDKERIEAHTVSDPDTGCWEYQGTKQRGYGRMRSEDGNHVLVHRRAYELWVAPIPDGLHLDHVCRNPACCNPEHLEPVTQAENMRRMAEHNQEEWTTCQSGRHPYPENRVLERSTGKTRCGECAKEAKRKYKRKQKVQPDV